MKKGVCIGIACMMLALSGCAKEASRQVYAMDTVMNFTVYGKNAEDVLSSMEQRVQELENLFSRTRSASEVSRLNETGEADVSFEVYALLETAKEAAKATGGAFDVTIAPVVSAWGFTEDACRVPEEGELETLLETVGSERMELSETADGYRVSLGDGQSIDLGGIAKGYASDCMADLFLDYGVDHALAPLAGNILAWGAKPDGTPWRIGIQDPQRADANVGVLQLENAFAVTSGAYERYFEQDGKTYHHIIDPATGYPAESDLTSVTIVMDWSQEKLDGKTGNGTICDALSTALFVMGEEKAVEFWRSGAYDFDMVLVTADGRLLATSGVADIFSPTEGSGYVYEAIS